MCHQWLSVPAPPILPTDTLCALQIFLCLLYCNCWPLWSVESRTVTATYCVWPSYPLIECQSRRCGLCQSNIAALVTASWRVGWSTWSVTLVPRPPTSTTRTTCTRNSQSATSDWRSPIHSRWTTWWPIIPLRSRSTAGTRATSSSTGCLCRLTCQERSHGIGTGIGEQGEQLLPPKLLGAHIMHPAPPFFCRPNLQLKVTLQTERLLL